MVTLKVCDGSDSRARALGASANGNPTCLELLVSRAQSQLCADGRTSALFCACEAANALGSLPLSVVCSAALLSRLGVVKQAMCLGKCLLVAVIAARVRTPLAAVEGRDLASALTRRWP